MGCCGIFILSDRRDNNNSKIVQFNLLSCGSSRHDLIKMDLFRLCIPYVMHTPVTEHVSYYIVNYYVKLWHVRRGGGGANIMHPLSWGTQTGKYPKNFNGVASCQFFNYGITGGAGGGGVGVGSITYSWEITKNVPLITTETALKNVKWLTLQFHKRR